MMQLKPTITCFRPLARQIGIYTQTDILVIAPTLEMFPAPFEVDRQLYGNMKLEYGSKSQAFPAPREVDRQLYVRDGQEIQIGEQFPAPREVDRYLYWSIRMVEEEPRKTRFRPLTEVYWELYRSLDWWGVQVRL